MSTPFRHRPQRFMDNTIGGGGGAGAGTDVTGSGTGNKAGDTSAGKTDDMAGQYQAIFEKQMAQQFQLFKVITEENDRKNEQSSHLALAKSVSEMV